MVTINEARVRHRKHKKGQYLHYGRLAPPVTAEQLLAALSNQYRITSSNVNGDTLNVQVDDKVAV